MQAWFLSLLNVTGVRGSWLRWSQSCARGFICELKEPPAGRVFQVLCVNMRFLRAMGCIRSSLHTNFHIWFNGLPPLGDTCFNLDQIQIMRSEVLGATTRVNSCTDWIYTELILTCTGL